MSSAVHSATIASDYALPPDVAEVLPGVEREAVAMAREAGRIVSSLFGQSVQVDYKDDKQTDPVTAADIQSQAYLAQAITERFPGHGILGEEKSDNDDPDAPAADWLWVLDPLDGTTNFLNGLPVWAVSIGVMYRGLPVAAALYLPWPDANPDAAISQGGVVFHARKGGGAFQDDHKLELADPDEIIANRLSGIPGSFSAQYRIAKALRRKAGEPRVTGSIAYELAMVARGVMQYCVIGRAEAVGHGRRRPAGRRGRRLGDAPSPKDLGTHGRHHTRLGNQDPHHERATRAGATTGRW